MTDQDIRDWELSINRKLNAIDICCKDSSFNELKVAYDNFEQELQAEAIDGGWRELLRRLITKRLFVEAYQHDRSLSELEQYFDSLEYSGDTFSGLSRQIIRARYLIEHGEHDMARNHLVKLHARLQEADASIRNLMNSL